MDTSVPADEAMTQKPLWKAAITAAALWLFASTATGFLVATLVGEHGSIIFAFFGLVVGAAGAVSHVLNLLAAPFGRRSRVIQVLSVWAGAVAVLLILAIVFAAQSERPFVMAFSESLSMLVLYCAPSALLGAVAFVRPVRPVKSAA